MIIIDSILDGNKLIPARELTNVEKNTVIGVVFYSGSYHHYQLGEGVALNNKINELMGTNINNGIVDEGI